MHFYYLLALFPLAAVAQTEVNGQCAGVASGFYQQDGICITISECDSYHGSYINNGCPGTADDVKCCVIGHALGTNPCGGDSACVWTFDSVCSDAGGHFETGYCPGGSDYECCIV